MKTKKTDDEKRILNAFLCGLLLGVPIGILIVALVAFIF